MKNPELYAAILSVAGALGRVANGDPAGVAALDYAFEHLLATDPDTTVHGTYRADWARARSVDLETHVAAVGDAAPRLPPGEAVEMVPHRDALRTLAGDYATLAGEELGGEHAADLAFMAEVATSSDEQLGERLVDLECGGWRRIAVERELGRRGLTDKPTGPPGVIDELLFPQALTVPPPCHEKSADP